MTIRDFYTVECLAAAKNQLIKDVDAIDLTTKRPYIPSRRDGEERIIREVDDLLMLLTFSDEQKILDKLPRYVADNPDDMPNMRLYDGDLNMLTTLLRDMSGRLGNLESAMAAICNDVRKIQVWPSLPEPARPSQHPGISCQTRRAAGDVNTVVVSTELARGGTTAVMRGNPTTAVVENETTSFGESADRLAETSRQQRWGDSCADGATTGTLSVTDYNRFAPLASTSAEDDGEPFNFPSSRRKKRRRQHTPQQLQQSQPEQTSTVANDKAIKRPGTVLLGKASSGSVATKLTAANKIRKKAVFCIDNVNSDCTVDDIKVFVNSLSVQVVTCYEVRPRRFRRGSINASGNDRKAFRLCIYAEDRCRLLDESRWPDSVTLSDWFFKPRTEDDNKRPRLGSPDRVDVGGEAGMAVNNEANGEKDNDDTILQEYHTNDGE